MLDDDEAVSKPGLRTIRVLVRLGTDGDVNRLLDNLRARPEVRTAEFDPRLPRFFSRRSSLKSCD